MASFPPTKAVPKRNRVVPKRNPKVSNGGLGGCVPTAPGERCYEKHNEGMGSSPWALRRKKLPSAVNVGLKGQDLTLSTMTPASIVLHDDETEFGDFGNPFSDQVKKPQHDERVVELVSPIEESEMGRTSPVFVNRPQTPPTPGQTATLPIELPGSILLPSQGFPQQNPPVTPARDSFISRYSEESRSSRTPSLDTSSSTDGDMDILRNFASPQKKSGRANTFPVLPVKNASRAFAAMSADELMHCLPELNMSVVSQSWVPAMETELKRTKALLQEAAELRLQSQADLESFGTDVNSIAVSARDISRTYFDAMQRVRPLADRDAKAINDQLEFIQEELQTALTVVEESKNTISDKDNIIDRLHETIAANARTLGGFIEDHVGSHLNDIHDIRTQEIKQLMENQRQNSLEDGTYTPGRYIRIPEHQYSSYLQNSHAMQQKIETYSKITNDQLELIKSQSTDLDKRMEGYGEALTIVEKRDSRIVELESKLEETERELKVAKESVEAYRILKEAHNKLTKRCTDLEWTLQSIKSGFKKQLEDRDTEIFTLRQQLGDAVMEVAARKAEARTTVPQPESVGMTSRFKNPLHLGKNARSQEQQLPINARRALLGGKFPASQSMLSLNTSQANLGPDTHPAYRNTPSPLSDTTRPSVESSSDRGSGRFGGRWLSGLRMNPPDTSSSASASTKTPPPRPRKDSLRTADNSIRTPGAAAVRPASTIIDCEKALPSPPVLQSANIHIHNEEEDEDHFPAVPPHTAIPITTTPRRNRRVLSGITERSTEDGVGKSPPHTTSPSDSDKNAFRSSMAILDRFDGVGVDEEVRPWTMLGAGEREGGEGAGPDTDAGAEADERASANTGANPSAMRRYYDPEGEGGSEVISPKNSRDGNLNQPQKAAKGKGKGKLQMKWVWE